MEYEELKKKVERLERDNRVLFNLINKQKIILNEFVALLEIQCLEDISRIEIKEENSQKRVVLASNKYFVIGHCDNTKTLGYLIDEINKGEGFHVSIAKRYLKVPVSKLPVIKYNNLYTNNCLVVIKL